MAKRQKRPAVKKEKSGESDAKPFGMNLSIQTLRVPESQCILSLLNVEPLTQISVNVQAGHEARKHDGGVALAVVTTVDAAARPVDQDNKSFLKIVAKAECVYGSPREPSPEEWPQVMMMGIMSSWPMLRDAVSSMSMRTGQPPILLPLLYIDAKTQALNFLLGENQKPAPAVQIDP
jgi:hypothetical protein